MDSSALLHAWQEGYPPDVFPALYEKLKGVFPKYALVLKEIFSEIKSTDESNKFGDLRTWLRKIPLNPVSSDVESQKIVDLSKSFKFKENSREGLSRKDMSLVVYAQKHGFTVVTQESPQVTPPKDRSRYRIPRVCEKLNVKCMNWVEFLRACQVVV